MGYVRVMSTILDGNENVTPHDLLDIKLSSSAARVQFVISLSLLPRQWHLLCAYSHIIQNDLLHNPSPWFNVPMIDANSPDSRIHHSTIAGRPPHMKKSHSSWSVETLNTLKVL